MKAIPFWLLVISCLISVPALAQSNEYMLNHEIEAGESEIHRELVPILLAPGFWAKTGSSFEAIVDGALNIADGSLDAVIEDEMRRQDMVGLAVGIVENGQITYTKGFGYEDIARNKPITTSTVFHWGSISKTMTAVAAHQLKEAGLLSLNDKVSDVVSYWPRSLNRGDITASHLLTHRSGIAHTNTEADLKAYKFDGGWDAEQSIEVFDDLILQFAPGTQSCYTTFGYTLLGAMIEEASPSGYVAWVYSNIKAELGMSSLTEWGNSIGGFQKNCQGALSTVQEADTRWKLPGGGWASNVQDLTVFMQALMNNTLLNNTEALWANPGPIQDFPNCNTMVGQTTRFGVDWRQAGSRVRVEHAGVNREVLTLMAFYPQEDFGIALMINGSRNANQDYVDHQRMFNRIAQARGMDWGRVDTTPIDACQKNAEPCGSEKFTGVFRKFENEVLIRRGYNKEDFYKVWKEMKDAGYVAIDLETYSSGGRKWDAIFQQDGRETVIRRDLKQKEFGNEWDDLHEKGFRLLDIETYKDGTVRKWAGVFVKDSGGQALFRDLNNTEFMAKNTELQNKGYQLIDVEPYLTGTNRKWAGVWRPGPANFFIRHFPNADFLNAVSVYADDGLKLIDVETYLDGTARKWAAVFEASNTGQIFRKDKKYCTMIDKHADHRAKGFQLIDLEFH